MPTTRARRAVAAAAVLAAAIALASCTTLPATAGEYCSTSIGSAPLFTLTGFAGGYDATRPGSGGVTVVEIPVADVRPEGADFVTWDVLERTNYNQPTDDMQYYFEPNPTWGTAETVLHINVYEWTPPATYALRVRGLAFEGEFDGNEVLVGECFHDFDLVVD